MTNAAPATADHIDLLLQEQADMERRLPRDHYGAIGRSRADLAMELYLAGRLEDARSRYLDALTAYERALGEEPAGYTFLAEIASIHGVLAECVFADLSEVRGAREHAAAELAALKRLRDVVDHAIVDRENPTGETDEHDPPF